MHCNNCGPLCGAVCGGLCIGGCAVGCTATVGLGSAPAFGASILGASGGASTSGYATGYQP